MRKIENITISSKTGTLYSVDIGTLSNRRQHFRVQQIQELVVGDLKKEGKSNIDQWNEDAIYGFTRKWIAANVNKSDVGILSGVRDTLEALKKSEIKSYVTSKMTRSMVEAILTNAGMMNLVDDAFMFTMTEVEQHSDKGLFLQEKVRLEGLFRANVFYAGSDAADMKVVEKLGASGIRILQENREIEEDSEGNPVIMASDMRGVLKALIDADIVDVFTQKEQEEIAYIAQADTTQNAVTSLIQARDAKYSQAINASGTANLVNWDRHVEFVGGHDIYRQLRARNEDPDAKYKPSVIAANVLDYNQIKGHMLAAMQERAILILEVAKSQLGYALNEEKIMNYIRQAKEETGCDIPIIVHGDHIQYDGKLFDQKAILVAAYDGKEKGRFAEKYDAIFGKGAFKGESKNKQDHFKGKSVKDIVLAMNISEDVCLQVARELDSNAKKARQDIEVYNERLIKAGFTSIAIDASTIYDQVAADAIINFYAENQASSEEEKLVANLEKKFALPLEWGVQFLKLDPNYDDSQKIFEQYKNEITFEMQKRGKTAEEISDKIKSLKKAFGILVEEARANNLIVANVIAAYSRMVKSIADATIKGEIEERVRDSMKKWELDLTLPTSNARETAYQLGALDELVDLYNPALEGKLGKEIEIGHVDSLQFNPNTGKWDAKLTHPVTIEVMGAYLKERGRTFDLMATNNGSGHGTKFDKKTLTPESQVGKISPYLTRELARAAALYEASIAQHGTSGSDDDELRVLAEAGVIKFNIATNYQQLLINVLYLLHIGKTEQEVRDLVITDRDALMNGLHVDVRNEMMKIAGQIVEKTLDVDVKARDTLFMKFMKKTYAWGIKKKQLNADSSKQAIATIFAKEFKRVFGEMDEELYDLGAVPFKKHADVYYAAAKTFGENTPFSAAQFAERINVSEVMAKKIMEELWLKNKNIDKIMDASPRGADGLRKIKYIYSPVSLAVQLAPGMKPEDFPTNVPMTVIVGHSEVRDYLGIGIYEIGKQANAFREAGFKVVQPFGDFPEKLGDTDYLKSGHRMFPTTYEAVGKMATRGRGVMHYPSHIQMMESLYSEGKSINTMSLSELKGDVFYGDIYKILPSQIKKEFEKLASQAKAEGKDLKDLLASQEAYKAFYEEAVESLSKSTEDELATEDILGEMINIMMYDTKEVRRRVFKELSSIYEINYQIRPVFGGLSLKELFYQTFIAYEPIEGIRDIKISDETARLRKTMMIQEFVDVIIPKDISLQELLSKAREIDCQIKDVTKKKYQGIVVELKKHISEKLEEIIIYGGGANEANIVEVGKDFGGAFIGRAIFKPQGAINMAAAASASEKPLTMIYNFKAANDGPYKDYHDGYRAKGINFDAVNLIHGVSLSAARPAFREMQGENIDHLYTDAREETVVAPIVIDARNKNVATRGIGSNTGHFPAETLAKAGVTHAVIDITAAYAETQVRNLVAEGISPVIFRSNYDPARIANFKNRFSEEIADKIKVKNHILPITPISMIREVRERAVNQETKAQNLSPRISTKPEITDLEERAVGYYEQPAKTYGPKSIVAKVIDKIKQGLLVHLTAVGKQQVRKDDEAVSASTFWGMNSVIEIDQTLAGFSDDILLDTSAREALIGKEVIREMGVTIPGMELFTTFKQDAVGAEFWFCPDKDEVLAVTAIDSKSTSQAVIGFNPEAIKKYKDRGGVETAYKAALQKYAQSMEALAEMLYARGYSKEKLTDWSEIARLGNERLQQSRDVHEAVKTTIGSWTELAKFDNVSVLKQGDILSIPAGMLYSLPKGVRVLRLGVDKKAEVIQPENLVDVIESTDINVKAWENQQPELKHQEAEGCPINRGSLLYGNLLEKGILAHLLELDATEQNSIIFPENNSYHMLVVINGKAEVEIVTADGEIEKEQLEPINHTSAVIMVPASAKSYEVKALTKDTKVIQITTVEPVKTPVARAFNKGTRISGTEDYASKETGVVRSWQEISDLNEIITINGQRASAPAIISNREHDITILSGAVELACGNQKLLAKKGKPVVFGPGEILTVSMDHKKGTLIVNTKDGREFSFPDSAKVENTQDYKFIKAKGSETVELRIDYKKTDLEKMTYKVYESLIQKHLPKVLKSKVDLILPKELFSEGQGLGSKEKEQRVLDKVFGKGVVNIWTYVEGDFETMDVLVGASMEKGRTPVLGAENSLISKMSQMKETDQGYNMVKALIQKTKIMALPDGLKDLGEERFAYTRGVQGTALLQAILTADDIKEENSIARDMKEIMKLLTGRQGLSIKDLYYMLTLNDKGIPGEIQKTIKNSFNNWLIMIIKTVLLARPAEMLGQAEVQELNNRLKTLYAA
ncbi:MAG: class II fructose-bisphosphate aldolase [Candidatus Omnitrophota bacterium]